jgi:hypothetical protein
MFTDFPEAKSASTISSKKLSDFSSLIAVSIECKITKKAPFIEI